MGWNELGICITIRETAGVSNGPRDGERVKVPPLHICKWNRRKEGGSKQEMLSHINCGTCWRQRLSILRSQALNLFHL